MDLQSPRPVTTVRRNPPRKAKQASSAGALSSSKPSNAVTGITPFPLDEILEPEPLQTYPLPNQKLHKSNVGVSNNLKVFLRIRPLMCPVSQCSNVAGGEARAPGRGRVSKEGDRKNMPCLVVNSSSSVTLNAPLSSLESKRAKNEVYDGFSHVFPPESIQEDIYDKVMQPLVMDFMEGHSSLLVAMGPTGSGKTYTMFGSPQQPGIVPLALRQIFKQTADNVNIQASRTYYLSIFEIHSERGKVEKIFDLLPESMPHQQASISSLKEVKISSVADAEKIVAHGIFKRSTAPTNANNQSSRSQCIINVRCIRKSDADDHSCTNSVLTIADLAGAERERKTGNQGARLLESNFINNTSMVFGQCLRSLLEHQKNPKKPIEKHFKNSLLTRHLQDYMEGKKQMTLILTVKAAQEDYMDTSFILRQASPYMKIKFYLQENNNIPCQKRKAALFITERTKRRKANISEVPVINGNDVVMDATASSKISVKDSAGEDICKQGYAEFHAEFQKIKRSEEVMRNFARALLSTLKQYKDKLKESENEVQYLKETLRKQSAHAKEMEKELNETRNIRLCVSNPPVEECAKALSFNPGVSVPPIPSDPDHIQDTVALGDENNYFLSQSPETSAKIEMGRETKALDESLSGAKTTGDSDEFSLPLHPRTLEQVDMSAEAFSSLPSEENVELSYQYSDENSESFQKLTQSSEQVGEMGQVVMNFSDVASLKGPRSNATVDVPANVHQFTGKTANHSYCFTRPTVPLEREGCILRLPGNEEISIMQAEKEQSGLKIALNENVQQNTASHSTEALKSEEDDPSLRPLNSQRPKRMLLPASTIHFKDFNGLFMDENAMEVKRKKTDSVKARSDGSISLIRILKSNLPR
ncbi:kinesin-like protein KIN-6 isoform X2 [Dendrobium catenatum]|uniref:kinesin-like protein KIN-6 isoform X2 n=1 Tax=Dendrobium catenatum TaxID=906689 RepID=UPI0009F56A6E|nr:kinesin-like protein KIN-6 isoform X2 [Dendrobium catenatum]